MYAAGMATAAPPVLAPRERRPQGCRRVAVVPDLDADQAGELARIVKALADPTRLRIVDGLRKASPAAICQCELVPLFEISQPALSKHLRVLLDAGVIACERRGTWAYYFLPADGRIEELTAWLR